MFQISESLRQSIIEYGKENETSAECPIHY